MRITDDISTVLDLADSEKQQSVGSSGRRSGRSPRCAATVIQW